VVVENMDAYYDFHVNRLSEIENVGNVQSVFVMGVIKQRTIWFTEVSLYLLFGIAPKSNPA